MPEKQPSERSALERALSVFTEVHAGEGVATLLLTLNIFLLLTAYSIIKPVREGLILALESGAEYKSYMSAVIAVVLLVIVPIYARFVDRLRKNRLVVGVTLFFAANLVLFFLGTAFEVVRRHLGLVFYAWVGVFNMMVVAQFWAFCNDLCTEEQGRRLFPLLGFGQTVGAAAGSGVSLLLLKVLDSYSMLLVAAVVLALCALTTQMAYARGLGEARIAKTLPKAGAVAVSKAPSPSSKGTHGAFRLVWSHRYLTLIAAFTLVFTLVNTNGEFMLGKLFKAAADEAVASGQIHAGQVRNYLGERYSAFFLAVNVLTMLLQGFVVSRVVKLGGLRVALMVLPVIALFDAAAVAVLPVLAILRIGKIFENSADYSFNNTARNLLWLRTTTEMKYKAKQAVDTFFVRIGDVVSALCVYVGAGLLGLGVRSFALLNLALVGVWFWLTWAILRENARLHADP